MKLEGEIQQMKSNHEAKVKEFEEKIRQLEMQKGPTKHILYECEKCKEKHRECKHASGDACLSNNTKPPKTPRPRRYSTQFSNTK